ncbi:MAG TPA: hypothetical protein PK185_11985 [Cyclobacteriaceae bacterium]|nr:hypothetical protein [Cyclobacteriaceae bacterium]
MKFTFILFFFLAIFFNGQSQNTKSEILQEITELKNDIRELEAEIKEAEKDDPEEAAELRKELAMLKRALNMLQKNESALVTLEKDPNASKEDEYEYTVPSKDESRVGKISEKKLDNKQLTDHVSKTVTDIEKNISPKMKAIGLPLYTNMKKSNSDSVDLGNMAVGIWIMGNPELALYTQSLACKDEPLHADLLNNFGAMLIMSGAEEKALPILQRINIDFPKNEMVLHNLGMAWYGLGELTKAEKYLDSAMMFPGHHAQAKFTKGLIEEKKGNKTKAIENIKQSMKEGYSEDKKKHLEKLGAKNIEDFIANTEPIKEEYLGLQRFINMVPNYPKNGSQLQQADADWRGFKTALDNQMEKLNEEIEAYEPIQKRAMEKFAEGQIALSTTFSPVAKKYIAKNMNTLILPTMEELGRKTEAMQQELIELEKEIDQAAERMDEQLRNSKSGEANCRIISEYLEFANGKKEVFDRYFIKFHARIINTMAQYHKYYLTPTPETYKLTLLKLQHDFLQKLSSLNYIFVNNSCGEQKLTSSPFGRLAIFEDVNCDTHSELWMPGVGTITFNCHYMEATFDPWTPLPVDLKVKLKDDLLTGQHVGGSVTIGSSASIVPTGAQKKLGEKLNLGPGAEKVDVKVSGSMTVEWDSQGITDVSATVGVNGEVGNSEAGVSQKFILKAGPSTAFKNSSSR